MSARKAAPDEEYRPEQYVRGDMSGREGGTGLRAEKNPTPVLRVFTDKKRPYWGIWLYQGAGFGGGEQDYDEKTGISWLEVYYRGAVRDGDKKIFADYLLRVEAKGQTGFEYLCYQLSKQIKTELRIGIDTENKENPVEITSITLTPHIIHVAENMPQL